MKQATATAISNATLDWRDGESRILLEFPFGVQSKQAPGANHRKRPETQTFEMMLAEVAQEQLVKKVEGDHLGCRIVLVVSKRKHDLDNCVKSIWDGLKQIAFEDDKVFDYLEVVRVKAATPADEAIVVEIVEIVPKREAWV